MKYTEKQIDSLVLMAIKKISEHPDETFKPRPMTIASFLKGTKHSPYYSYYSHYPSLCGSIILTAGQANSSCKRLVKDGKIKKVKENKSFHYEPCGVQLFIELCIDEEREIIDEITAYVKSLYPSVFCENKPQRFSYTIPEFSPKGTDIIYSWFWFTKQGGRLVFKYKIKQTDSDKTTYENNIIYAEKSQIETIKNLISLLTR